MDFPQSSQSLFFTFDESIIRLADAYPYLVKGDHRLRNRLGFHAALLLLSEAAMERLVLPYNDGESLDQVGLLSLRMWDFGGEPSRWDYYFIENFLCKNLDDPFKYGQMGRTYYADPIRDYGGIRFAFNHYYYALIRSNWSAASRRVSLSIGAAINGKLLRWEVFPPCVHPLAGEMSDGFEDIATTSYVHNQAELEAVFANRRVVELQEMETGQTSLTMEMLVYLMCEAYEGGYNPERHFSWQSVYPHALVELSERKIADFYPDGKKDAAWIREAICRGGDIRNYPEPMTARPNLDLMALIQIMLACHWANWARIDAVWSHLHEIESVTREYRVTGDGSVILLNEYSTYNHERLDKLEWSRSVSSSSNGGQAVGSQLPYTLDMRFSADELARTCPGFLLTADEIRQCGGGQEVAITPEGKWTVEKHFSGGDIPLGYNDDGTIDLSYFDQIGITVTVTSSRCVPVGDDDRSRLNRTDYPAATLIENGRVESLALASALAVEDRFHGYEADEESYVSTREPDKDGTKVKLIVKKATGQVTAQSVTELVGETVSDSYAAHSLINNNPCDLLETFTPNGIAAHGADLGANIPDYFWAWYDVNLSPMINGKYAPYQILFPSDYHLEGIDYRAGYYAWSRVGYCQAFVQDATVKRCSEHLIARHSSSAAVRAEWAWKAMPVTWN